MKTKLTTLVLMLGAFTIAHPVLAQEPASPQAVFYRANEAYKHGRFQEAATEYKTILETGLENGIVYYNLGNALLKAGNKAEAYWAYLKAAQHIPADPDLHANLAYVRSILPNDDAVSVKTPKSVQWLTANGTWPTRQLAFAAILLVWFSAIGWMVTGWLPYMQRAVYPTVWLLTISALIVISVLSVQTLGVDRLARAVIIQDNAEVRFAPQDVGTVHFSLPEGAIIRLLQKDRGWAQVSRADGRTGWIADKALKQL